MASSVFISSEISLTICWRISWGSAKYSIASSWSRCPRMRWERRRIFSRESFIPSLPGRASQDDPLLPGHLLLEHLEHLRVGDVRALHLGGVLHELLADLLVEAVLHAELVGDHADDFRDHPSGVVDLELLRGHERLHDLAGDELDLVGGEAHRRRPSIAPPS